MSEKLTIKRFEITLGHYMAGVKEEDPQFKKLEEELKKLNGKYSIISDIRYFWKKEQEDSYSIVGNNMEY